MGDRKDTGGLAHQHSWTPAKVFHTNFPPGQALLHNPLKLFSNCSKYRTRLESPQYFFGSGGTHCITILPTENCFLTNLAFI